VTVRKLRLAFFGTPEFAVPSLERLLEGPHPVVAVVSQPDRRRGRGRRVSPSPVARVAERAGIPLLRPERVGDPAVEAQLRTTAPDLGAVVAFGQFLPRRIRELPSEGYLVNGHASLLPKYRGAAPIARAILAGEGATGASIMRVEREMDAGPCALRRELAIREGENAGELSERLARLAAEALAEVIDGIAAGDVSWQAQVDADATLAPKIERGELDLDFRDGADALVRRVRAFAPTPGAVTRLDGESLRILAAIATSEAADAPTGTVRRDASGTPRIATGDGWLVPLRLQRAGGRAMDTADFLRGRPIPDGTRLG
jgi:methionyl-tRNA formyltransferase